MLMHRRMVVVIPEGEHACMACCLPRTDQGRCCTGYSCSDERTIATLHFMYITGSLRGFSL
jgi:hypothetical protein